MGESYERPTKRQKLDDYDTHNSKPITSTDQLHQLLEFQQSTDPYVKGSIVAFKDHLVHVAHLEDVAEQSKQLRILKEYCEWQKATTDDQVDFYDILSTWSFAVENNAEAIISAAAAALAQFLKTISGSLELRPFGLGLIKSLLGRDQSKLFEKCLASPRTKPHLASPCLRLLTEMVSFDAGSKAIEVWTRRELFMQKFEALLEQQSSNADLVERRKPSVRRMGIRLLISLLKYLDAPAKIDLLSQARALVVCIRGLSQDGDDILIEFLTTCEQHLINDDTIPRESLIRFFNLPHLEAIVALYKFNADEVGAKDAVRMATHEMLLKLCTDKKGILLTQHGWYPPFTVTNRMKSSEDDYIDLGLESLTHMDNYKEKVPVTNNVVSALIQKLRPHEDVLHSELLLSIFRAAPELVADYFTKRKHIPSPSSDDVAWRGHFAFLFSIAELPVPEHLDCSDHMPQLPPPLAVVVESILPRPLDRTYLTKLLSSTDDILRVSGARLLTVALQKLEKVLGIFSASATTDAYLWNQAGDKLLDLVETRIPVSRDVSLALQHASSAAAGGYTVLLECLYSYYRTLPNISASTTFDIGPAMRDLCTKIEDNPGDDGVTLDQLTYCLHIAELLPSTKWLHKTDNETLSPLGRLLQVAITIKKQDKSRDLLRSISKILTYRGILSPSQPAFAALCASLAPSKKFSPTTELLLFLDTCIVRANQKPVKFLDEIEYASNLVSDRKPLSLLVGAVTEQWSFALKKYESSKTTMKTIAAWIARLFAMLDSVGENYRVMTHFQDTMLRASPDKAKGYFQDALDKVRKELPTIDHDMHLGGDSRGVHDQRSPLMQASESRISSLERQSVTKVDIPDSLTGLDKWPSDFDIELEIRTQRLDRLLLCISSSDEENRLQAFQVLQGIAHTVDTTSTHQAKQQIFLLLGEVCETIRQVGLVHPLPTAIPELACAILPVLLEPTHRMYGKINKYLLHKPYWTSKGMLKYWIDRVLLQEPENDEQDAWNAEVQWLLRWLYQGLRNEADMDLYRRLNIWEHVLSLYAGPCMQEASRQLILVLLWQSFQIPGGADMLWTRFGVNSWLGLMQLQDLRSLMEEKCDTKVIELWKSSNGLSRAKASTVTV